MHRPASFPTAALRLLVAVTLATGVVAPAALAQAPALATYLVQSTQAPALQGFDAVVEAVRDSTVSTQVPGAVVQLAVRVGDRVQAGQELLRLDAQSARQNAAASSAQVEAARTQAQLADSELARQRQLHAKQYISQAGLERAQAQADAAQAQVRALQAQAGAAAVQAGLHVVRAPYSGVIGEVPVALGDMATPGRPLLRLYDPGALRITATLPLVLAQRLQAGEAQIELDLPGQPGRRITVNQHDLQRLPTVDRQTHTVQMRVALPAAVTDVAPGMFARLWLPVAKETSALEVPASAVLRRSELTAVYVLDANDRPRLRQVRLGQGSQGADAQARLPVLTGLRAGERVVLDPQAAAKVR